MTAETVSVVTVAYNSAHVIRDALSGLSQLHERICVDNASTDDLDAALRGLDVRRIRNDVNRGFGTACNQGAAAASGTFLLFLNPDVVLSSSALDELLSAAERYPDCGAFLPFTKRPDGTLWIRNNAAGLKSRRSKREDVGQVVGDFCSQVLDGAVFLMRRSLFMDIGGFDEKIFLYYEDDDLSRRLVARHEAIIVVQSAKAEHSIGKSVSGGSGANMFRNKQKKISQIYYNQKYGIGYSPALDLALHVSKLVAYAATGNRMKLAGAYGRTVGILQHMTDKWRSH